LKALVLFLLRRPLRLQVIEADGIAADQAAAMCKMD